MLQLTVLNTFSHFDKINNKMRLYEKGEVIHLPKIDEFFKARLACKDVEILKTDSTQEVVNQSEVGNEIKANKKKTDGTN